MKPRNNRNLKAICVAMQLNSDDVVEVMESAGENVSRSRANGWLRGETTRKKADPGSHNPDNRERRMKVMDDDEFDQFCSGLATWARNGE